MYMFILFILPVIPEGDPLWCTPFREYLGHDDAQIRTGTQIAIPHTHTHTSVLHKNAICAPKKYGKKSRKF